MGRRARVPSQKVLMAMSASSQAKFQARTSATTGSTLGKTNSPSLSSTNETISNVTVANNVNGEKLKQKQAMN